MREEFEMELENRIRNLMWTVSGDYTLDVKPDLESFRRSRYIALYDGIKQGAFARYFDREELSPVSYTHLDVYKRQMLSSVWDSQEPEEKQDRSLTINM